MHSRSPLLYSRPGHPLDGLPLSLIDRAFNHQRREFVVGAGIYSGPTTAGSANGWTLSEVATGLGNVNNVGFDFGNTNAGALTLTTDNALNDLENLQYLAQEFRPRTTPKAFVCFALVAVSSASCDALLGLVTQGTDLIGTPPTSGIYFLKPTGTSDWALKRLVGGVVVQSVQCGFSLGNGQFVLIGFRVDSHGVRMFAKALPGTTSMTIARTIADDVGVGTLVTSSTAASDNIIVYPSFAVRSGSALSSRNMSIDFALFYQEK